MAGLMLATVVPRSLGLVAALAVSGTTLYLFYGYKKRNVVRNMSRGKESWRIEYLHGGSAIQQQQQMSKKETAASLEVREGERNRIGEMHGHQLAWLQQAILRLPRMEPVVICSQLLSNRNVDRQEQLKDRLVNCQADGRVNAVYGTSSSYRVDEQQEEQLSDNSMIRFSTVVSSAGRLENSDSRSADALSPCDCGLQETPLRDTWTSPVSQTSSSKIDSSPKAYWSAAPPSSFKSGALVGCFMFPGSRKAAGKPKKVVRFCACVVEPSSNNKDYRNRCRT